MLDFMLLRLSLSRGTELEIELTVPPRHDDARAGRRNAGDEI